MKHIWVALLLLSRGHNTYPFKTAEYKWIDGPRYQLRQTLFGLNTEPCCVAENPSTAAWFIELYLKVMLNELKHLHTIPSDAYIHA